MKVSAAMSPYFYTCFMVQVIITLCLPSQLEMLFILTNFSPDDQRLSTSKGPVTCHLLLLR